MISQPQRGLALDGAPPVSAERAPPAHGGRLFRKYLLLILSLVTGAMLTSGAFWIWSSHQDNKAALASLQHEKALAAAARIEQYISGIEQQLKYAALPQLGAGDVELRRIEFLKLLRQVPEITDIAQLDGAGREQLLVSRLAMDSVELGKGPVTGAGVPQCRAWPDVVRSRVLPQGDRAVHDDRASLGQRRGTGDDRRRQPEVHLGRRVADQDRRQGQGVRRRRQRLPRRRSRHRPRAAQDQPVGACRT